MPNTRNKLSIAGSREPFGKVTKLEEIPSALFEILHLASGIKTPEGKQLAGLVDNVITVALSDPDAWIKLEQMASNGFRMTFSRQDCDSVEAVAN